MYATVVPAVRSIRGKDEFAYSVPNGVHVEVGQVVQIPWRSQVVEGIIWKTSVKKPSFPTKSIISETEIILQSSYVEWIDWFSTYYYIAKSHVAKMVIPDIPRRKSSAIQAEKIIPSRVAVAKDRVPVIQKMTAELERIGSAEQSVIVYSRLAEIMAIVSGLLSSTHQKIAIILGEEYQVDAWAAVLQKFAPVVVHSRLAKGAMFSAWRDVCLDPQRIYIGTKRLSLFPLHVFDTVIIVDPENSSHKQWDLNPRYSVPTVVQSQLKNTNTRLVYFSQSPTVELIANSAPIQTLLIANLPAPPVTLIDMTSERFDYDQILLSRSVWERCNEEKAVFLWLNKKGSGTFLICKTCDELLPDTSELRCPKCKGINLVKQGLGTASLVEILRTRLPHRTILELTKDTGSMKIPYDKNPIIVGTTYAETQLDWNKIGSVIIVSIDHLLSQPEFRSTETTLQNLVHLRNAARSLVIQTYAPNHPVFKALNSYFPDEWYQKEIQYRKEFSLPPFGTRIWLRNTVTDEEKIVQSVDDIPKESQWIIDREL